MHRSASNTRVSDEYSSKYSTSPASQSGGTWSPVDVDSGGANHNHLHNHNHDHDHDQLPVSNPNSYAGKKDKSRPRSSENVIHLIPVVLIICVIILWFCSNPVDVIKKDNWVVARVEGLKVAGGVDVDGTQNSFLPHLELELDLDDVDLGRHRTERKPLG
ncbi:hypothetical protein Dimus_034847 [Dionaea muscipula]